MSTGPGELSGEAASAPAGRRFVVSSPNNTTAPSESLALPVATTLSTEGDSLLVCERGDALTQAFRNRKLCEVSIPDARTLPPLEHLRNDVTARVDFLLDAINEDRMVESLPIPGHEVGGNGIFILDRLQWLIIERDQRPFVRGLPWDTCRELVVVGGQPLSSPLVHLMIHEARSRGLPVLGRVKGPLTGRWAPMWIHACDALEVGDEGRLEEAFRHGITVPLDVEPSLEDHASARPWTPAELDRETVVLDIEASTQHRVVMRTLGRFVEAHPNAVSRLLFPVNAAYRPRMEAIYGSRIGEVPIVFTNESIYDAARAPDRAVLSFDPYRIYHAASVLGPVRLAFLAEELRCMSQNVSSGQRRLEIASSREAMA